MAIYTVVFEDNGTMYKGTILNMEGHGASFEYKADGGPLATSNLQTTVITAGGSSYYQDQEAAQAWNTFATAISNEAGLHATVKTQIDDFNARVVEKITDWTVRLASHLNKFKATAV